MASAEPNLAPAQSPHLHIAGEVCPLCDQPIPAEKLVEIQQRERLRADRQTKQLREEFAKEKASALAEKTAEIEAVRQAATKAASAALAESEKRESAARTEAKAQAEATLKTQMAKAEAEITTAQEQLKAQLAIVKENTTVIAGKDAEIASVRQEAISAATREQAESKKREAAARLEAKTQAEAAMKASISQVQVEKTAIEEKLKTQTANMESEKKLAQQQLELAKKEQAQQAQATLQKELSALRESMEKATTEAVQKEQAKAFEERQKTEAKLETLQRQIKKERADELGEAAEFVLLDELKKNFGSDVYNPIAKGAAGADLWQDVMHNGKKCGRIVFDSKNRDAWRNDYVSKLKTDQLNAGGDHAVLTTRKFPAGTQQLHVQDGVIISHPARVIALITMLREQIIHSHRLEASNQLRDEKTEALYNFINSERCNQIFEHFVTTTEDLLELDVFEKKQHDKTWQKRGALLVKAQRTIQVQLRGEIDRIIVEDAGS